MMPVRLCLVVLAVVTVSPVKGRILHQTGDQSQDFLVNIKNTFAEGDENDVGQLVNVFVPMNRTASPNGVDDKAIVITPARVVDRRNPDCSIDHPESNLKLPFNTKPYSDVKTTVQFYVSSDVEVKPVAFVTLKQGRRDGTASVVSTALNSNKIEVRRKEPTATVCGEWTHDENGLYEFEISTDDSQLWLQYYVRKRTLSTFVDEVPINLSFQLDQTIVGNSNNVRSNADVNMAESNGKLVISLRNAIKGSNNAARQTASGNGGGK